MIDLAVPQKNLIAEVVSAVMPALSKMEEAIGYAVKANLASIIIDKNGGDEIIAVNEYLKVNATTRQVFIKDIEIAITPIEFKLLLALVRNKNKTQERSSLLADVWNQNPNNNTRTVDTHIARLRVKLREAGNFIHTVSGIGYVIR